MDATQLGIIGLVIVLGSALQTAVGFGAGLFAIPIMVWTGVPLPQAVTIATVYVAGHNTWAAYRHRHDICWRSIGLVSLMCVMTLPLGVVLLEFLVTLGERMVKFWVGCGLLLALGLMFSLRVPPRPRIHPGWTVLAGGSSGVLSGVIGMGGPPLVLWVMAHDWSVNQTRATLWTIFMLCLPAALAALAWRFGGDIVVATGVGLAGMPLALVGAVIGHRLSRDLSAVRLRRASFALLVVIALSLIMQSM